MSDTDKTKPFWVQLAQNPQWREEDHDHRSNDCDLPDSRDTKECNFGWSGKLPICKYTPSHLGHRKVWARASKIEQMYANKANGRTRTKLRQLTRDLLKTPIDEIIDCEDLGTSQHRHCALWEVH